jgi:hypothetical protein
MEERCYWRESVAVWEICQRIQRSRLSLRYCTKELQTVKKLLCPPVKRFLSVKSVKKHSHRGEILHVMCGYTPENIHSSVRSAEKHFLRAELLPYIAVSTAEINHTHVRSVVSHSQEVVVYEDTVALTVVKNLSSVRFVVKASQIVPLL